jgi:hypothetical protein
VTAIAQGKSIPSPHGFVIDDDWSQTLGVITRLAVWLAAMTVPWAAIVALALFVVPPS